MLEQWLRVAGATWNVNAHNKIVHLYVICGAEAACSSNSESVKIKPQNNLARSCLVGNSYQVQPSDIWPEPV